MKKALLVTGTVLLIAIIIYQGNSKSDQAQSFRATLDSLNKQNDSLEASLTSKDAVIDSLAVLDSALVDKLAHQKPKVITITKFVDSSKSAIDTYSEQELVSSFNKRYPEDTTSNLLAVAQPVLKSAAKDLVDFDGEKQLSALKDSVITIQEERLTLKETIIREYVAKEENYKGIIINKNVEIKTWNNQYDQIQKENKKLKQKSKIQKIVASVVAGTLAILVILK